MFPSCSTEHIAAEQPNTSSSFFFLILLAENFLPCLTSRTNKIQRCHKGFCGCLTLAQQPQAGPCLVPISSTAHGRCPGNGFAQELFPIQRSISLLPPPPGSFGAGHEGGICFNPKASPSEERGSELELYSSPASGDESQSWGNAVQRRNRSPSSPGRDFSPCTGEVAVPKLTDTQQNHQQDKKKNPGSFHSHLWGDNRERFCFRGHKSAKLRTLGVLV